MMSKKKRTIHNFITDALEAEKGALSADEILDTGISKRIRNAPTGKTPQIIISAYIYSDLKEGSPSQYEKMGERPTRFSLKR